jgi:hypothetical protein
MALSLKSLEISIFVTGRTKLMPSPHQAISKRVLSTLLCMIALVLGCKPQEEVDRESAERATANAAANRKPIMADQVAGVGVGAQGRSLEGGSEYNPATFVSGPAAAYFRTKEKIVFEIQIPHTLNAFVALNGRHPQSHEEYMREIVGTDIKLPRLPEGMVYRYHPDSQELWVEKEKKDDANVAGQTPSSDAEVP